MNSIDKKNEKDCSTLEPLRSDSITNKNVNTKTRTPQHFKIKAVNYLKNAVHILNWLPLYNLESAINDVISGITLGLTIIPESIACALLAGLPPHYGLCSAFIGSFVYLIFGTIDKVIVGPTSLVALVSLQFTMGKPIELAFILTFLTGIVQLLMGALRLGFIFEFISMPVIKAFSTATAFLVIESQLKVLLGIKYVVPGFISSIQTLVIKITEANMGDLIMGISAIVFLIVFEVMEHIKIRKYSRYNKMLNTILQYLSLSRNTLIVLITGVITYIWINQLPEESSVPYNLSKNALAGLPIFKFPQFSFSSTDRDYSYIDILWELKFGILVIPIIGVLTNISIGKLTAKGVVNANQELFTLGLCNVIGSGVQSMPTSGAFTRSAISAASGIRTPMANLYSGIIVLLALSFLSPYFNYIPESTLAAILICAIVSLIDFKLPIRLWNESKRDFSTWLLCFITCVIYGVEVGLFVGIAVTCAFLLYLWSRPEIHIKIDQINDMEFVRVTPHNSIYFPAINYVRERTIKACKQAEFKIPVVIDCQKIDGLDYTAAQGLTKLSCDICPDSQGQILILYKLKNELQQLIDTRFHIVFSETEDKLKEILTQEFLRNGHICLKDHIRASIDLGYKIELEQLA